MVTNFFGNINFMHSMGKPKRALKVPSLLFFLLRERGVLGAGGGSHYVPFKFPMDSHQVPHVPNFFLHNTPLFIAYVLANVVLLSLI
jgi:hypothetical protein